MIMNYRTPNYGFPVIHLPEPAQQWNIGARFVRMCSHLRDWIEELARFIHQKLHLQASVSGMTVAGVVAVVILVTIGIALGVGLGVGLSDNDKTEIGWSYTGTMNYERYFHTSSVLKNGEVLVVGGGEPYTSWYTAEIYNPSSKAWTLTSNLNYRRFRHTASVLTDGNVLVVGGDFTYNETYYGRIPELYNSSTGLWTSTGTMNFGRVGQTASLLLSGEVLIAGGYNSNSTGNVSSTAELYNPLTGSWTRVGNMNIGRWYHTATLLTNGYVLVTGGHSIASNYSTNSAELYDPVSRSWTLTNSMSTQRVFHTASILSNGNVLVVGGQNDIYDVLDTAELYNPLTRIWTAVSNMNTPRALHTASVLNNDNILIAGGWLYNSTEYSLKSAELYILSSDVWTLTSDMNEARCGHTASVLQSGQVLVSGGYNTNGSIFSSAELYSY